MSSNTTAIKLCEISKRFEIFSCPGDRLKQFIYPRLASFIGIKSKQYYRDFWALKDISFEVKRGETLGIIGKNGSGKSTLLQLICGTLHATTGNIQINGRVAAILELGSGFNPEFTGVENICLSASVYGFSNQEINDRLQKIILFADIGDYIDQPLKTYSSGMVVRLAFAVIAHVDADILVIDEALAVGDAFFNQKCMRFLREFKKSGTIIFVTHDISALTSLCTQGIFLHDGRILEMGSSAEVAEKYLTYIFDSTESIISADKGNKAHKKNYVKNQEPSKSSLNPRTLSKKATRFDAFESDVSTGQAEIICIKLLNENGMSVSQIVGGENVIVEIQCFIHMDILSPIVGFEVKNRLGQVVFADNTYLSYANHQAISALQGNTMIARFQFAAPFLPNGDYCVSAGIAEGSQNSHIMHFWIHEGMIFHVHSSTVLSGLLRVPMKHIELRVV